MINFILNEETIATDLPPGMVILDFIRYHKHLTGTKIGCREGDCGACTVLVGEIINNELRYESMTSCLMPIGNAAGKHIVTIEGINFPGQLNPVQHAMADCGATQCGFCTPGFVMSLAGFCLSNKQANNENAIAAVDGNICRCTGYKSIERAAGIVAETMEEKNGEDAITFVTGKKILPEYFSTIKERLISLEPRPLTTYHSPLTSVGGGTDLYVQKHDEMAHAAIQFLFDRPAMNGITEEDDKIVLGPSVTVSDLKNSPIINKLFQDFQRFAKLVSSTPIRNMATIGGNFVNASPIGDFTIFFLALNASLSLTLSGGEIIRTVPLRHFYKGYKQLDKSPDEIVSKIWFEKPAGEYYFNFEKVSKRTHLDIASVNSAILIEMDGDKIRTAGISAGGVGPVPMYLQKTSDYLKGKTLRQAQGEETINKAIEIMKTEISPISDVRGSMEYKTLLLGQLIKAHMRPLLNPPRGEDLPPHSPNSKNSFMQ